MTEFENTIPGGLPAPAPAQPAPDALPEQPGAAPRTQTAEDSPSGDNLPDLPCDACRDLIPLVQDGAASEISGRLVAQHIARCPACRAFWQSGAPANRPNDSKVLGRIHRRLRLLLAAVLVAALTAGTLFGLWLMSFGFAGQFNLIVMPVVGAAGALLLRRCWYLTPLCVAALGFVWHFSLESTGPVLGLLYAAFYGGLCLLGGVAALLFRYAFGKEDLP